MFFFTLSDTGATKSGCKVTTFLGIHQVFILFLLKTTIIFPIFYQNDNKDNQDNNLVNSVDGVVVVGRSLSQLS